MSKTSTLTFDDGGRYVGETRIDSDGVEVAQGKGRLEFASGEVYEGDFIDDNLHGKGTYTWPDGTTYCGDYVDGEECGYGVFKDASSGERYEGEWKDTLRNGQGTSTSAEGTYVGQWKDNLCHGKGRKTYADGGVYAGEWIEGLRHGTGTIKYADNGEYQGEWRKDVRHGQGCMRLTDGGTYEGTFHNNVFDGEGKYTWPDGTIFQGTFVKGERHGYGRQISTSGAVYVGTWAHNEASTDVVLQDKVGDTVSHVSDVSSALRAAIDAVTAVDRGLPPIVHVASSSGPNRAGKDMSLDEALAEAGNTSVANVIANLPNELKHSVMVTSSILPQAGSAQLSSMLAKSDQQQKKANHPPASDGHTLSGSMSLLNASASSFSSTGRGISLHDLERFTKMNLLGRGSFGAAYEAVLPTGRMVCVKVVELGAVTDAAALAALYNEIALMQRLHHPNIVDFYGCIKNEETQTLNIFMEYITGGSLVTYAKKFKVIPEPTIRRWSYQMVCGVKYLHDHSVIHRDIKGDNILMTNDGVIKLADFGCSKALDVPDSRTQGCSTMVGTPYWMAPEVIMCSKDGAGGSYGTKADIWSVGCTIMEMITGKPPWPECTSVWRAIYQIANATGPPPIPESIQGQLRSFLLTIFERDPMKRPSADELLRHPYLAGYNGH